MSNVKCFFGIHDWKIINHYDGVDYRQCFRCGKTMMRLSDRRQYPGAKWYPNRTFDDTGTERNEA